MDYPIKISIHAPAKGATKAVSRTAKGKYISIHAPAKGATGLPDHELRLQEFQSTLPQRERHLEDAEEDEEEEISIHAPAKGATTNVGASKPERHISIHAPAKGATHFLSSLLGVFYFNPRSRKGSDEVVDYQVENALLFQSTLPQRERR